MGLVHRRIAVLTSGGDAPGMNAAIRSVVRCAAEAGIETVGVRDGYAGLAQRKFEDLTIRSVGGILHRGGTVLGSARFPDFCEAAVRERCIESLSDAAIDGLVVIGGNGSQRGAHALHQQGFPTVGIASTIDNDLAGTDITIGVDTALNTAVRWIDQIKDTATSHHRAFVVEVMGRDSGYLAVMAAIATGAELAMVPEQETSVEAIAGLVRTSYASGRGHYIIVVAEGAKLKAHDLVTQLNEHPSGFEARLSVLGHVQRGGSPSIADRVLGSQLGAAAVAALAAGQSGVVAGRVDGKTALLPGEMVIMPCQKVTAELLQLAAALAQ
ncbi:MAG TPA: ATP-dependent 6-phosphofructokinase [Ktedonobacterales bacterium]